MAVPYTKDELRRMRVKRVQVGDPEKPITVDVVLGTGVCAADLEYAAKLAGACGIDPTVNEIDSIEIIVDWNRAPHVLRARVSKLLNEEQAKAILGVLEDLKDARAETQETQTHDGEATPTG